MKITIGIYVHAEPERLQGTLAALSANTTRDFNLVLLPDGPDERTATALSKLATIAQAPTSQPLGTAACFNRLAQWDRSDRIVLLESGSLPGPGWLDYLMQAMDVDTYHGLAGPSTNLSWNEQAVFPRAGSSFQAVRAIARLSADRY